MRTLERGQVFFKFDARLFLNHVRIAKKTAMRKEKTQTITIPAMEPGLKDDAEAALVSSSKGVAEDVGGDKIDEEADRDEDRDMDEDRDIEEDRDTEEVDVW